jgi:hypothetical protein
MGDNSIQEAIGKGCINIFMTIKKNVLIGMLTNVIHVPKFAKNMFSFSIATSHGHILIGSISCNVAPNKKYRRVFKFEVFVTNQT